VIDALSIGLMVRRRVSAVSNHGAAPSFEARVNALTGAPQDEGGARALPDVIGHFGRMTGATSVVSREPWDLLSLS
jgi:hypothetical protein